MIGGLKGFEADIGRALPGIEKTEDNTAFIQGKVSEYIQRHPSLKASPISMALAQNVARGQIPRSRQEFESFQTDFMAECLKKLRATTNPNAWTWLQEKINSTHLYDWKRIEEVSQGVELSQAIENPDFFVDYVKTLVQTGKTRYLEEPKIAPLLKNPLLMEALIDAAASSSDEDFKSFVKKFFSRYHLFSNPQDKDPDLIWLSQVNKDSPLTHFFQKIGVLDKDRKIQFDVLSLKEPIKILQHLLKAEARWMDEPFDYENVEKLNTQMQTLALRKFSAMFAIEFGRKPTDPVLINLRRIQEKEIPLEEKLFELQNTLKRSRQYPILLKILTEIFSKSSEQIDQIVEDLRKENGIPGQIPMKNSLLWKIKDSWNLERKRTPEDEFGRFIKLACNSFFSNLGIDTLTQHSLAGQFINYSIAWEIFTDGLIEEIQELSLDPIYRDLVILAFTDKNASTLLNLADLITYQKYLYWVKNLPVNHPFQKAALKMDLKCKVDKLTCKEKLERMLVQVASANRLLSESQQSEAVSLLSWSSVRNASILAACLHLPFKKTANNTLQIFTSANSPAKAEMLRVHQCRQMELQSLNPDSPFGRFLQEKGFFTQKDSVLTAHILDDLPLYRQAFIKRLEYVSGQALSDMEINEVASILMLQRLQREVLPQLPSQLKTIILPILAGNALSAQKKIEEIQRLCNVAEITTALNSPLFPSVIPDSVLQGFYHWKNPVGPSFLKTFSDCMQIEQRADQSLEEYVFEKSRLIQFLTRAFFHDAYACGVNITEDLQSVGVLDLKKLEGILQKVMWAQYQAKLQKLPQEEPGIAELLQIGSKISIAKTRERIQNSRQLSPERKTELSRLLSFETKVEAVRNKIDSSLQWLEKKARLYQLPIPKEEFALDRTGYQKWSTIQKGLSLFFYHIKPRAEKAGLDPDYLLFLEAALLAFNFKSCDMLLKEIEENTPDWDKYL